MPIPSLVSAIVSSVVSNAADQVTSAPPPPVVIPMVAVGRVLPDGAARGEMVVVGYLSAEIDGKPVPLAPGVQVRNESNLIVMPSTVQAPVPVRYLTDPMGAVYRVWILSAREASQ